MAVRELLERDPREFRAVRESGSREEPENRDLLRRGRWSRSPSMPLAARPTTTLMERRSINRNSLSFLAVFLAFALVAPATAQAQRDDEIIDRVVVRNRKHTVWNTPEIAPSVGISLVNRMTQQYNFQLGIGFNFSEQWALDVRGGYALGGLTSVGEEARTRRQQFMAVEPVDEFQDLWRMTWQALVMPRWSPIYGQLNVC